MAMQPFWSQFGPGSPPPLQRSRDFEGTTMNCHASRTANSRLLGIPGLWRFPRAYAAVWKAVEVVLPTVTKRIQRELAKRDEVFFVQIGSNDGKRNDPIHDLAIGNESWNGLFVEPVPQLFEKLKET